jgi:hypothetical protein
MKMAFWLLALVGAVLLSAAPVSADDSFYVIAGGGKTETPIHSVPYTINSSGMYYLAGNFTSTGTAIIVNPNISDVTIDLTRGVCCGYCASTERVDGCQGGVGLIRRFEVATMATRKAWIQPSADSPRISLG